MLCLVGVLVLGASGGGAARAATLPRVLICATISDYDGDVQSKLTATGLFSTVDLVDCSGTTPTVSQLKGYSSVFVFSDDSFDDSVTLGDNLAAYSNGGGHVVEATFNWDVTPLGGAWASGGYSPLTSQDSQLQGDGPLTLVPVVSGSPLLAGVSSFSGGSSSYRNNATLAPGATLIATWNDTASTPLVATKGCTVALNFYPPSSDARTDFWDPTTKGVRLMTNALLNCVSRAAAAPFDWAAWYTAQPHTGYCAVNGNTNPFTGKPIQPGTFLLLITGQPSTDPHYTGALPANYFEGKGITCDTADGYVPTGKTVGYGGGGTAGPYPYYTKA
jgi:hypothetical protein